MTTAQVLAYPDASTLAMAASHRALLTILDAQCSIDAQCSVDTTGDDARNGRAPIARHHVDLALTGGSDALRMMELMSRDSLTDAIDWSLVRVWWADERFVASDDPDRNALQARARLLGRLVDEGRLPESNIHEMPADARPAAQADNADDERTSRVLDAAAAAYESELRRELGDDPRMDLLILGMGPDGHYASLFPGHPEIAVTDRLVVGVDHSPKPPARRLSMTVPLLSRSTRTWMLTAGDSKISALSHALRHPRDASVPASFTAGTSQTLWMTTEATVR